MPSLFALRSWPLQLAPFRPHPTLFVTFRSLLLPRGDRQTSQQAVPAAKPVQLAPPKKSQGSRQQPRRPPGPPPANSQPSAPQGIEKPSTMQSASMLRIQNLMLLCKQLNLPVNYKVYEIQPPATAPADPTASRKFSIIVHVLRDQAFKKFQQHCSLSDLMLFRGLLLRVEASHDMSQILSARVQQAFLPKFENEGQASKVADEIVQRCVDHYMVATIKHSGSLVTLSSEGFAAKNSLNNEYTAGAAMLLRAHFQRVFGEMEADAHLVALLQQLGEENMAVSFEMVTGCHGHHGQLPAAEYLVTTSAHGLDASGNPSFLPWDGFLRFCLTHHLPMNDTWLIGGREAAQGARDVLDTLALRGGPTAAAVQALTGFAQLGGMGVHLPGTYPHAEWQGDRIEGFVVSSGQPLETGEKLQALNALAADMSAEVLPLDCVANHLRRPYQQLYLECGAKADKVVEQVKSLTASWLPQQQLHALPLEERKVLEAALLRHDASSAPKRRKLQPAAAAAAAVSAPQGAPSDAKELRSHPLLSLSNDGAANMLYDEQNRRLYRRAEVQDMGRNELLELVQAALKSSASGAGPMVVDHGPGSSYGGVVQQDLEALRKVKDELASLMDVEGEEQRTLAHIKGRTITALAGRPDFGSSLRYKKKMVGYTLPPLQRAPVSATAAPIASSGAAPMDTSSTAVSDPAAAVAAAADVGGGTAHGHHAVAAIATATPSNGIVGYCLLTFVIRNGLRHLKSKGRRWAAEAAYFAYVQQMTSAWGLPPRQKDQIATFARAWANWVFTRVPKHGGVPIIEENNYLDYAEPFCRAFLEARGEMAVEQDVPQFKGLLLLVNSNRAEAEVFADAFQIRNVLEAPKSQGKKVSALSFSQQQMREGALLWISEKEDIRGSLEFIRQAAPYMYVVQGPAPALNLKEEVEKYNTKCLEVKKALQDANLGDAQIQARILCLPAASSAPALAAAAAADPHAAAVAAALTASKKAKAAETKAATAATATAAPAASTPPGKDHMQHAAANSAVPANGAAAAANGAVPATRKSPSPPPTGPAPTAASSAALEQAQQAAEQASTAAVAELRKVLESWCGLGITPPNMDPAVVLCFLAIPGSGKTVLTKDVSLLEAGLVRAKGEQQNGATAANSTLVKVLNSDVLKASTQQPKAKGAPKGGPQHDPKRYWEEVAAAADETRGPGHATLVVADKNLVPSPPGQIERAADALCDSGALAVVAVVPTCRAAPNSTASTVASGTILSAPTSPVTHPTLYAGLPDLPFPVELIALCMMRVLQRQGHEGKLDAEHCPTAATVVTMFARFWSDVTLEELLEQARQRFTRVIELPIMELGGDRPQIPMPLLQHVADGLRNFTINAKQQLPEEWEQKARKLLLDPVAVQALQAHQVPLEECRGLLQAQLRSTFSAVLSASSPAEAASKVAALDPVPSILAGFARLGAEGDIPDDDDDGVDLPPSSKPPGSIKPPRYISLTGFDTEKLLAAVRRVLPEFAEPFRIPGGDKKKVDNKAALTLRKDLHITLWHSLDSSSDDGGMRDRLLAVEGSDASFEVREVLTSPQVTAASTVLIDVPDAANSHPHITLHLGPGSRAVDSNKLPGRLAAGDPAVRKVQLLQPLTLTGKIKAVYK